MLEPIVKLDLYEKKIERAIDSKKRRVLFRQGGYLKTTMQRSFRTSKKPSKPGMPPRVRDSKSPLKKGVAFDVDLQKETVTCGPMIWPASKVRSRMPLPQLLNEGGTFDSVMKNGKKIKAVMKPRPFTQPIFSDGGKNFAKLLRDEPLK